MLIPVVKGQLWKLYCNKEEKLGRAERCAFT